MHALLERLAKQDALRLPLGPLGADATAALAADLLGRRPDRELDGLVAQAEGNPLYVVEIVRNAATRDQDARTRFARPEVHTTRSLARRMSWRVRPAR